MERKDMDINVRIALLENGEERVSNHHKEVKEILERIWEKIDSFPCEIHAGDRKVLETKLEGINCHLVGMWSVIGVVFFALVAVGIKVILKA